MKDVYMQLQSGCHLYVSDRGIEIEDPCGERGIDTELTYTEALALQVHLLRLTRHLEQTPKQKLEGPR